MQLDNFTKRLDKMKTKNPLFNFRLGNPISLSDCTEIENKLHIEIPEKVKEFYQTTNGLITSNPDFEIIEIDSWKIENESIHFATFNKINKVFFEISKLNNANEWIIINKENGYEITLSISSFWSNKIWHWIENKKMIWADNWWET